ncbi:hypothetical protein NQ318_001022 [Aromia moschata]|uniref:Lipase n=1 Tax=Aromia moschata TaxID=1265417 RepID=A0AAV8ZDS1_9CUCU|nr:hypothetical protein NQ318_001022 [Aromia moschata]
MFTFFVIQLIAIFACARTFEINTLQRCEGLEEFLEIDCKFNPDDELDVPQIISRHGYPSESHTVATEDGYLLTLHRIPGTKNGKRGRSSGFFLADQGYDVWLGNARGSTYSKGHVSLPMWSSQYWNFSWHEMGTFDLPAALYYVSNITEKAGDIIYIGHSMGTTQFFVLSSVLPQVAKNVKLMIALAPVAYMTHVTSPIRYLAPFINDLDWVAKHLGIKELLPNDKLFKFLAFECQMKNTKKICQKLIFVLFGFDKAEFNVDILPTILRHDPAGESTKTVVHYIQEIRNSGDFQQYDYGPAGNMIKYGTLTPPQYKLENIKRPIYMMYAKNDILANSTDVVRLEQKLSNVVGMYEVPLDVFGHMDFIFGKDAYSLVYKPILKVMRNFTENE